jgi:hypothetical protein
MLLQNIKEIVTFFLMYGSKASLDQEIAKDEEKKLLSHRKDCDNCLRIGIFENG